MKLKSLYNLVRALVLLPLLPSCLILSWPDPVDPDRDPDDQSTEPSSSSGEPLHVGSVLFDPASPTTADDIRVMLSPSSSRPEAEVSQIRWLLNDIEVASYRDQETLPASETSRGDTWRARLIVQVDDGESIVQNTVTVVNAIPVVSDLTLEPDEPKVTDLISAKFEIFDADDDTVMLIFDWFVDDVRVPDAIGASLSGDSFAKHQNIRVEVTPDDGFDQGERVVSTPITAINSAPEVHEVELSPAVAGIEDTILATVHATDADDDDLDLTFRWFVAGELATEGASNELSPAFHERDAAVAVEVIASDGEEESDIYTADGAAWGNTPPVITSVELSPAEPTVLDVITATAETFDIDLDPVEVSYTWLIDGVEIDEIDGPALTAEHFSKGRRVTVRATPNDGFDDGLSVESDSETVQNSPPSILEVSLSPDAPRSDTTILSSIETFDADDDPLDLTLVWRIGGVVVDADGPELSPAFYAREAEVTLTVTATDDDGAESAPLTSAPVTWTNTRPTAPVVGLSPSRLIEGGEIICEVIEPALDVDGDELSYRFEWKRDGELFEPASTDGLVSNVAAEHVGALEEWSCQAFAFDGAAEGPESAVQRGSTRLKTRKALVATGLFHSLIVDAEGEVWGWGEPGYSGHTERHKVPTKVDSLHDLTITAVSAGDRASYAIDADGRVWAWGDNDTRQLGSIDDPPVSAEPLEVDVPSDIRIVKVVAGVGHAIALTDDGSLWAWGNDIYGQLGQGGALSSPPYSRTPTIVTDTLGLQVVDVDAGRFHTLFLTKDGQVHAAGINDREQLGGYSGDHRPTFSSIAEADNAVAIAAAGNSSFVQKSLLEDGRLYAWGSGEAGILGNGGYSTSATPIPVALDETIDHIIAGDQSVYVWSESTILVWGSNLDGQLGNGRSDVAIEETTPYRLTDWHLPIFTVSANVHALALTTDGDLYGWGFNMFGQVGDGSETNRSTPVFIGTFYPEGVSPP